MAMPKSPPLPSTSLTSPPSKTSRPTPQPHPRTSTASSSTPAYSGASTSPGQGPLTWMSSTRKFVTNYLSVLALTKAFLPFLQDQGDRILTHIHVFRPCPRAHDAMSKLLRHKSGVAPLHPLSDGSCRGRRSK